MTTIQLNCFLAVAETLNFATAANMLNVTQPAVTQQIHSLEKELNIELFKRTTRTVRLTPEGYIFLNDAKTVLHIINHAKKRFEELDKNEKMVFSIGCHSNGELNLLPVILNKMQKHYPTLYPVFQVVRFQHLYQLLREDRVDVILAFREQEQKKGYGTYKELAKINTVGIMPKNSPLAKKDCLTVADLDSEKVILFNLQNAPDCFNIIQYKIMDRKVMSDIYLREAPEGCITLAKAGFGIAILPDILVQKDASLAYIPFDEFEPMSYGAYYNSTVGKPALKLFLQICKENFINNGK